MLRDKETTLHPTNTQNPAYFHKVVDCQWACPAHTPVPEYIRLIGQGRYSDAYMINWVSNVFPGVLGRVCDRPCEPACRRGRVEENNGAKPEAVAICRLKRVAADHKDSVAERMPAIAPSNGKRIACVGAGPASLTVARDLAPLGYLGVDIVLDRELGPMMLELNARPGLAIQIANNQGLAPILQYAEKIGTIPKDPAARVQLGIIIRETVLKKPVA